MLKAMNIAGNAEGASGVREALKRTSCEEIRRYVGVEVSAESVPAPQPSRSEVGTPLDNAAVIAMVKVGLSTDNIVYVIGVRPGHYLLTEPDRADLRAAGVPDSVIQAIIVAPHAHDPGRVDVRDDAARVIEGLLFRHFLPALRSVSNDAGFLPRRRNSKSLIVVQN